ncbi:MAG: FtsW/RodA/SpoVE family cell cycle protein [Eubacteriaceae bacterium]|jgi:cell division protein FtsW (lipid II flippase)|nr:FtsW/RodA/SpoVE family cell cycle protein [Eubacteriaceae bacterium]
MFSSVSEAAQPLMKTLAALFESHPLVATYYTTVARWVFVLLAVLILVRSISSLLAAKNPSEIWAYLSLPDGSAVPLSHWENVLGRAKNADVVIDLMTVSRNHGTLVREENGDWYYNDLGSKGGSQINGHDVYKSTHVNMGDTISLGGVDCVLLPASLKEKRENNEKRRMTTKTFSPWFSLSILTIFQIMMGIQFIAARGSKLDFTVLLSFALLTVTMWAFCIFLRSLKRTSFEMECIAFFLCTINLAVVATTSEGAVFKQLIAIILGVLIFFILCWYLRDLDRALSIRRALIIISAVLLLVNLVFGSSTNGSTNWINVAGMSIQPSELVKVAYIFIGSATLDELYEKKNLTRFMLFSIFCLGCLAVMNDFGTAAIFFVTFVIISFLRSGDFSKLILILGVVALGGMLSIKFIPHITSRFATWTHAWQYADAGGYQQTRGMTAAASGGLLGVGAGNGWFHSIYAADKDLVFSLVSEEWGLIIALLCVLALVTLCIFAVRSITAARSTFYSIAACAATSLIIFQTIMNVLGSLDILPFTGVTLPFVSNGGTSMLASWGLLAFLKAADTRRNASIAVRPDNGEEEEDIPFAIETDPEAEKRFAADPYATNYYYTVKSLRDQPDAEELAPDDDYYYSGNRVHLDGDEDITDFDQLDK